MSSTWGNSDTLESLFRAIKWQRTLLEGQVGPLELFRDSWSPNNKALMDILYGFSTVLGISPTRFMVRGFLQREMGVVAQGTPLAELSSGERSSLLSVFFDDAKYGGMEWQLRNVLTLLKTQEVKDAFERRMGSAAASGVLTVEDSKQESGESESNKSPVLQRIMAKLLPRRRPHGADNTLGYTGMTTVTLVGSILLLIYILNLLTEAERLPALTTQSTAPDPEYDQVVTSLVSDLNVSDVRVKGVAFSALGQIGHMREDVIQALTGFLESENSQDRRHAAWAIARNISGAQEEAGQTLTKYVKDNPDLLSFLKRVIDDPAPRVACNAALALGGLGPTAKGVSSNLNKRLSDPNVTPTFKFALTCIEQQGETIKAQLMKRIGREDPLLDVGLIIEGRDFGGFDHRGGGAACMCTFS